MKNIFFLAILIAFESCTQNTSNSTQEATSESTSEEGVYFVNIEEGSTLSSPFALEMGVTGMQVEPKGAPRAGYGHHHLLIDDTFAPEGTVVVADETHIHYGGGQTSDSVSLDPGAYKLTLQFGDGMHVSYGEKWAKTISVTVE
ncbi:DUF4399 domain-containing protein [Bacteroidia bacterium]|nr:DUF4399 domain-containing protein [Bacteroidia bacterium]